MYCVVFKASCKYSSDVNVPLTTVSLVIEGTVVEKTVIIDVSLLLICNVAVVNKYKNVAWFTCTLLFVISVGNDLYASVNPLTCMAVCIMSLFEKKLSKIGILDGDHEFTVVKLGKMLLLESYLFRIRL